MQESEARQAADLAVEISRMFSEKSLSLSECLLTVVALTTGVFVQLADDELVEASLVHMQQEYRKVMQKLRAKP